MPTSNSMRKCSTNSQEGGCNKRLTQQLNARRKRSSRKEENKLGMKRNHFVKKVPTFEI